MLWLVTLGFRVRGLFRYSSLLSAFVLCLSNLLFFSLSLCCFRERQFIKDGRVLLLDDEVEHPDWLERPYVARLANRQARVVPSEPVESIDVPFTVEKLEGSVVDPFAAKAAAIVSAGRDGEYMMMFGVDRDLWNSLKGAEDGFPSKFEGPEHAVMLCEWTPFKTKDPSSPVALSSSEADVFHGKYSPKVDDVSLLLLIRSGDFVLALTAASDLRVLETCFFTRGTVFGVRETFAEEDEDCLVCCAQPKNTILLPCRHMCCCDVCLARMDKCPVCRAPVESFVAFVGENQESENTEHVIPQRQDDDDNGIEMMEM